MWKITEKLKKPWRLFYLNLLLAAVCQDRNWTNFIGDPLRRNNWWVHFKTEELLIFLLLKGIEERCDNQQDQQQDKGTDQPRYLSLAPCGLLDQRLSQRSAGGEAAEERWQDVAEANGVHLLVGVHCVAVLFGKHLRQWDSDGESHDGDGECIDSHIGNQRPHGQLGREEACGDVTSHAWPINSVEMAKVRSHCRNYHHKELEGNWSLGKEKKDDTQCSDRLKIESHFEQQMMSFDAREKKTKVQRVYRGSWTFTKPWNHDARL